MFVNKKVVAAAIGPVRPHIGIDLFQICKKACPDG
jgi:hypothetical protein